MKKLLIATVAAAMAMFASAKVNIQEGFESDGTAYGDGEKPGVSAPYPFSGYGDKYKEISDEAWTQSLGDNICVDMVVKFDAMEEPTLTDPDAKVAVCLNKDGKFVVFSYMKNGEVQDSPTLEPGSWARLTITRNEDAFAIYINGTRLGGDFYPIGGVVSPSDASEIAFTGAGALDNFVARTTNPFEDAPESYYGKIGGSDGEYLATAAEALVESLATDLPITLADGTVVNGSASNPYQIPDLATLKAFQAAVADGKGADKCYVQTADIALDAAWPGIGIQNGKDIYNTAAFDNGAFRGTYDGGNYTISNFQMVGGGLDYCGFFNSTCGATIKNLKIQYAGSFFAADTTASTAESGATFVGVAKNSTLQNLTTLAGTVSCSKGFGGIVGYLTSGTTVNSCTNNVNMTSLANNKCGGIAMIAQGGSAVTIRNCQNNGTQTTGSSNSEYGAIVGYVGLDITIANCETTVGRFLKHQGSTVTLQGVNKGDATVASYHGAATPGLNFATVDGNVATFVADDALVSGETYKVMGPSATATFEFAEAGTIAFDTALATPTFAITAVEGLEVTDATAGTVKTYTAAVPVATDKARIGEEGYPTVTDALMAVYMGGNNYPAGTVIEVLDDEYKDNGNFATYFAWDAAARTYTRLMVTSAEGSYGVIADSKKDAEDLVTVSAVNEEVKAALGDAKYDSYFKKTATDNGDGTWSVSVELNKAVVLDEEQTTLEEVLEDALDDSADSITISAKNGLYYSLATGTDLSSPLVEGDRVLAKDGVVEIAKPANAKFYQVQVHVADK